MTFTQLATEICKRAGEGYQDFTDRAKEYLKTIFETLMLSPEFTEMDYYGQVQTLTQAFDDDPLGLTSISANLLKIISIRVDDDVFDELTAIELTNTERLGDLLPKNYFYVKDGKLYFQHAAGVTPTIHIRYLNRYVTETPTESDLLTKFSDRFINRSMDLCVESLYREISR